jgi:hypothetical protein
MVDAQYLALFSGCGGVCTGVTVTAETVGCPKVEGGSVWLKPPEAASTTAGALEFVVTTVVLTMTLPAMMLLMSTYAHMPFRCIRNTSCGKASY